MTSPIWNIRILKDLLGLDKFWERKDGNKLNLKNRVNQELDSAGIFNEQARNFFLYIIDRTIPGLKIENLTSENNIIRRYVRLLPKIEFPFIKSNQKLLILPADVILNDVLYSEKDLSMFFIIYARFCLFLEILHEIYPSWFEFLSLHPNWTPAPWIKNPIEHIDEMFKEYKTNYKPPATEKDNIKADNLEDKRLFNILTQLSGCYYLPFSSDCTAYNQSIFSSINSRTTF